MAAPAPQCNRLVFFRDRSGLSLLARTPARRRAADRLARTRYATRWSLRTISRTPPPTTWTVVNAADEPGEYGHRAFPFGVKTAGARVVAPVLVAMFRPQNPHVARFCPRRCGCAL